MAEALGMSRGSCSNVSANHANTCSMVYHNDSSVEMETRLFCGMSVHSKKNTKPQQ